VIPLLCCLWMSLLYVCLRQPKPTPALSYRPNIRESHAAAVCEVAWRPVYMLESHTVIDSHSETPRPS
jgi:hypothetical protein